MLEFNPGSTHILSGQSGSGKTRFILRILQNMDKIFGEHPPLKIRYYYGIWQDNYDQMKREIENISFQQGLPSEEELMNFTDPKTHTMIIIDDLMDEACNSQVVELIFTRISHHRFCSCFYIVQNAFVQGKKQMTINLNTKYVEVFRSPRSLLQLTYLNNQIFPNNPGLLINSYKDIMNQEPFGYILIDLTAQCPDDLRIRTKIFPSERTIVYKYD
jgi:hypothetical protein